MGKENYDAFSAAARRFLRGAGGTLALTVMTFLLDQLHVLETDPVLAAEAGLGVTVLMALDKYVRTKRAEQ